MTEKIWVNNVTLII